MLAIATLMTALCLLSIQPGAEAKPSIKATRSAGIVSSCTEKGVVALTFDDGPGDYVQQVVDMIDGMGGKATFFINGNNAGCVYSEDACGRIGYAYQHGFQIGSHTWGHKDLSTLSEADVEHEMKTALDAIRKITGAEPAYTRPPYGGYNDQTLKVAEGLGQTLVLWDHDSGDSSGESTQKQMEGYDELIKQHPPSILSLQHDIHSSSVLEVLPHLLEKLHEAEYKLVTVAECLGKKEPYRSVGKPEQRDGTWKCEAAA